MSKKKLRPMGEILLELEPLILEMVYNQGLQNGDIYGILNKYLEVHCPSSLETYDNGEHPILYYGPKEGLK